MVRLLVSGLPGRSVRTLRDTGHEVVLVDPGVSAEQLAATAVQEDVVAIAVADSGADLADRGLPEALSARGAGEILVFILDAEVEDLASDRPTDAAPPARD